MDDTALPLMIAISRRVAKKGKKTPCLVSFSWFISKGLSKTVTWFATDSKFLIICYLIINVQDTLIISKSVSLKHEKSHPNIYIFMHYMLGSVPRPRDCLQDPSNFLPFAPSINAPIPRHANAGHGYAQHKWVRDGAVLVACRISHLRSCMVAVGNIASATTYRLLESSNYQPAAPN